MVWTVTACTQYDKTVTIEAWCGTQSMMGGGDKTEEFPYSIRRIDDE